MILYLVPSTALTLIALNGVQPLPWYFIFIFMGLSVGLVGCVSWLKRTFIGVMGSKFYRESGLPWISWIMHALLISFLIGLTYPTLSSSNADKFVDNVKEFTVFTATNVVKQVESTFKKEEDQKLKEEKLN